LKKSKLESALTFLNQKEAEVAKVKENVLKLKTESDLMLQKKAETESLISQTTIRLSNAEKLTELLKEEGERWKVSIEKYHGELATIIGDVFLSASMVNYCGPLTGSFRQELMEKWIVQVINISLNF
jgi:Microtubule-binding stalk of dynein motor